jgi:hypothetical protein
VGGRARDGAKRQRTAREEKERLRRRERRVYAVLVGLGVVLMLGFAYPTYQYTQGTSVSAELTACGKRDGNRIPCTAHWTAADGRRCQARISADYRRWRDADHGYVRVDGCTVRGYAGPGAFYAGLALLLIMGVIALARRVRSGVAVAKGT